VQHGALVAKRLHTTVEEDASTKARLCGLLAKLEAAGAERLQLEHRLKLQRLEQAQAMNSLQVGLAGAVLQPVVEVAPGKAARKTQWPVQQQPVSRSIQCMMADHQQADWHAVHADHLEP
jgi:hypothetical protein